MIGPLPPTRTLFESVSSHAPTSLGLIWLPGSSFHVVTEAQRKVCSLQSEVWGDTALEQSRRECGRGGRVVWLWYASISENNKKCDGNLGPAELGLVQWGCLESSAPAWSSPAPETPAWGRPHSLRFGPRVLPRPCAVCAAGDLRVSGASRPRGGRPAPAWNVFVGIREPPASPSLP